MRILRFCHLLGFVSCFLFLVSCSQDSKVPVLPEGEQEVTGLLLPADISPVRRGSHVLEQDGIVVTYIETPSVALMPHNGNTLTLKGVFEHNTDPTDLPVFVVSELVEVIATHRSVHIEPYSLSLSIPLSWERTPENGEIAFTDPAVSQSVLRIERRSASSLAAPASLIVDGKPALQTTDEETGVVTVTIQQTDTRQIVLVTSVSQEGLTVDAWQRILDSVSFKRQQSSSSSQKSLGELTGIPCGGPAGVLCPTNYYCEVVDTSDDVGVCVKVEGEDVEE